MSSSSTSFLHCAKTVSTALLLVFFNPHTSSAFTIPQHKQVSTKYHQTYSKEQKLTTQLFSQKQTRSSLLNPPTPKNINRDVVVKNNPQTAKAKDEEVEDKEEVFGAKFFGGSAIKEELFDAELEEQADKMLKLYPPKQKFDDQNTKERNIQAQVTVEEDEDPNLYRRFMDKNAFPDEEARIVAKKLQSSINKALYSSENNEDGIDKDNGKIYSSTLQWNTPFSKDSKSSTPLDELDNALGFYKRIDVAIIAAKKMSAGSGRITSDVQQMEIRWEISLVWPNVFESRVLITGTSTVVVDSSSSTILSQTDKLNNGGKEGNDMIKAISSQLQPRFWDLYHIGMTPSTELMPHIEPRTQKKGILSSYDLYEIPERLVLQPTIVDSGGRDTRSAQSLPNHAFSSIIKTTGPTAQRYVTTSPLEVSIRRSLSSEDGSSKSIISWNIPVPPEFVSFYDELPTVVTDEDKEEGNEPTNDYVYQARRLVATMKYGGNCQDIEVPDIRKKLYDQVIKDGLKPKLGEGGRPEFFFLQNDVKSCFTAEGGLGMAVYEWRPNFANSNEVGIELEL